MNQNGDDTSNFSGFRVVGGPNQSISNSWVNGKKFFKNLYLFLDPKKKRGIKDKTAKINMRFIKLPG